MGVFRIKTLAMPDRSSEQGRSSMRTPLASATIPISNIWGLTLLLAILFAGLLSTPCFGQADDPSVHYSAYHFALTKGHHVPVCESFLKRLNTAQSPKTPYCGIPEDDS